MSRVDDLATAMEQGAMDLAALYVTRMLAADPDQPPGEEERLIARRLLATCVRFGLAYGEQQVNEDIVNGFYVREEFDGYWDAAAADVKADPRGGSEPG